MKHLILIFIGFLFFSCQEEIILESYTYDGIVSYENVPSPVEGKNYYRLNQFDFDGKNEIHDVMLVNKNISNARSLADQKIEYNFDEIKGRDELIIDNCWQLGYGGWDIKKHKGDNAIKFSPASNTIHGFVTQNFNLNRKDEIKFDFYDKSKSGRLIVLVGSDTLYNVSLDKKKDEELNIEFKLEKDYPSSNITILIDARNSSNASGYLDNLEIESSNPNFIIEGQCSNNLPITLLYQKGNVLENGIELEWETASEIHSDYVQVEWSDNGSDWIAIGIVPSKNKPTKYSFFHK